MLISGVRKLFFMLAELRRPGPLKLPDFMGLLSSLALGQTTNPTRPESTLPLIRSQKLVRANPLHRLYASLGTLFALHPGPSRGRFQNRQSPHTFLTPSPLFQYPRFTESLFPKLEIKSPPSMALLSKAASPSIRRSSLSCVGTGCSPLTSASELCPRLWIRAGAATSGRRAEYGVCPSLASCHLSQADALVMMPGSHGRPCVPPAPLPLHGAGS